MHKAIDCIQPMYFYKQQHILKSKRTAIPSEAQILQFWSICSFFFLCPQMTQSLCPSSSQKQEIFLGKRTSHDRNKMSTFQRALQGRLNLGLRACSSWVFFFYLVFLWLLRTTSEQISELNIETHRCANLNEFLIVSYCFFSLEFSWR